MMLAAWVLPADVLKQGVSVLDLRIKMPSMHEPPSLVPKTLFINNTLVKLTLGTELCLGKAPLKDVCLPLLKSLFLHTVWFSDYDLCDVMIHGCPELEELYIHHIYTDDREFEFEDIPPTPYYLYHDNIKKLTIRYIDDESYRNLKIYTPNLVYLDYSDSITCEFESENCLNVLLEARLNLVFGWRWRWSNEHINCSKIMDSICNVRILYLSSSTVEVMYARLDLDKIPLFKNLDTLHFESNWKEYWKLLWNMIEKSPKLETLVLKSMCGCGVCISRINIGGNVVKVLEIQGYKGRVGELNQVKFFLWGMENLEEMKVNISDEIENLQLTNALLALPKSSSKCNIHVL